MIHWPLLIIHYNHQDQWWYGELNNVGGWFPHSFVRMVSGPTAVTGTSPVTTPQEAPVEPPMPDNLVHDEVSEFYQALYPYQVRACKTVVFQSGLWVMVGNVLSRALRVNPMLRALLVIRSRTYLVESMAWFFLWGYFVPGENYKINSVKPVHIL